MQNDRENDQILTAAGVSVSYGSGKAAINVVQSLDLTVSRGELFVLLGPSGCGKTTLLRTIAGLQRPNAGRIEIDGECVFDGSRRIAVAPEQRPIAMVFQSYALWPHMSVSENVAFPLREGGRGVRRSEVAARVAEVLEMLALSDMGDRPVTTLSGGQQQRVALARALALRPKLLLMDEPLSNLDYELQVRLRGQLKELVSRLGVTTLYVTHNQNEALEMADRLAVMDGGQFRQTGTPRELYHQPSSAFVARFIGDMNLFPATVAGNSDVGGLMIDSPLGRLRAGVSALGAGQTGQPCLFGVRQEDVELTEQGDTDNTVAATVETATFSGESISYVLRVGETRLRARVHRRSDFRRDSDVFLRLPPEHCIAVHPDRGPLKEELIA